MSLENTIPAREIFSGALLELLQTREDILVLDQDRASDTGTCLVAESQPEKFLMLGATENNLVGVAAGLATMGVTAWVAGFWGAQLRQTLEQWCSIIGPAKLNVKLVAFSEGAPFSDCGGGGEFQDLALMQSVPNMAVIVPGDAVEARQAILAVSAQEGPAYIRLASLPSTPLCGEEYTFGIGRVIAIREGDDVAIFCTGRQTQRALHAATILETVGISALVLHVPTIQPLDTAAVAEAAQRVRLVVTAEEHGIRGGLGEAVAEALIPKHLKLFARFGFRRCLETGAAREGFMEEGALTPARMAETIHNLLRRGGSSEMINS